MAGRQLGWFFVAIVVIALSAVGIAAGRAIADDWIPVGDNAAIALDAHDVLSTDTPLLGARTTLGGVEYDGRVRHLGPLESWALAVPERIASSSGWGIVLGVALVVAGALFGIAWATARVAGTGAAAWALAIALAIGWSLGRQILVDPWNPYIAVFPLLAALFLAWAAGSGDAWPLPPLALAVSFVAQAHLLYVPLVVALLVGAAIAVVVSRPAVYELVATAIVLIVAWVFPIWDQINNRPGNVVELSRAYRADDQTAVGASYAFRALGNTLGLMPLFARRASEVDYVGESPSAFTTLTALALVLGLVVGLVFAIRKRDRVAASAAITALLAMFVAVITTAQVPVAFPDVARYRLLFLWPVGAFAWFAAGLVMVRLVPFPVVARRIGVGAGVALLVLAVPAAASSNSAETDETREMDAVRALAADVEGPLEDAGPVLVVGSGEVYAQMQYGLVRELRRRGVDARVAPGDVYLDGKYFAPADAATLYVVGGDDEVTLEYGPLVAEYDAFTAADRAELEQLDAEVRALLARTDVAALAERDPYELILDGTLLEAEASGEASFSDADHDLLERYRKLRFVVDELTFAAYVVPAR